ncbi:MAG: acyl-CoA carboxylase epsilon subunit [Brachybacterium sp.]|uniref:acyl-CoA carboxylase epsilon subunit n=1 Tax=Brachybacterium sp. Z12 TaxID=2759167 RepID=UPI0021E1CFE9|nr:acyl-CoA carboxylase epsilon subunit [Brachybacterium sp. Z12]
MSAAAGPARNSTAEAEAVLRPSDVRLVKGHLRDEELAAIAVVVSAMSVTSRLEADERLLAEGLAAGAGAWSDPVHCHPRAHGLRGLPSAAAWQFSDR